MLILKVTKFRITQTRSWECVSISCEVSVLEIFNDDIKSILKQTSSNIKLSRIAAANLVRHLATQLLRLPYEITTEERLQNFLSFCVRPQTSLRKETSGGVAKRRLGSERVTANPRH